MELKGSKTEANLWKAFAGESQARNKYDYYASKAKKEGYEQIAALFQETALNEKEHAKLWFKALDGIGTTAENLVAAAAGENEEWTSMYAEMARTAEEEGFLELAAQFEGVARIEKAHDSALIALVDLNKIAAWIVIIIIAREFIISGFRLVASDNGVVIAASYWGKFKTTFQMLMIIYLVVDLQFAYANVVGMVLVYVALALTVISLVDYIAKNYKVFLEGSSK